MRSLAILALALGLGILLQTPAAGAVGCGRWNGMDAYQKADTVAGMIDRALRSNKARQYRVDVADIGRCLDGYARRIQQDIDAACSDPRSGGMSAPDSIFKNYIWSCVR